MAKKLCLVILDGFGVGKDDASNPIFVAKKEGFFDIAESYYSKLALSASGISVGLPYQEPGNSETGHMNIGAGFIVYQSLQRIGVAIKDGTFFENPALVKAVEHIKKNNSTFHIMGLISSGNVHSSMDHLMTLIDFAVEQKLPRVWLHLFTDGRDSPPNEGTKIISKIQKKIKDFENIKIATIVGRSIAMDRDKHWERTQKAYESLTEDKTTKVADFNQYLEESYKKEIMDEFIEPAVLENSHQSRIKDGDAVFFFNFREDRARQLTKAFVLDDFREFARKKIKDLVFVTMSEYEKGLTTEVVFGPPEIPSPLGAVIANAGLKQYRVAETTKYAHITYFLNGMREEPFENETRELIPSYAGPRFDEKPEMAAHEIMDKIIAAVESNQYDVILTNFANADMVGHTGNFEAIVKAIETLDHCLAKIMEACLKNNWFLAVTADHGNSEEAINLITGEVLTEHSSNLVPFYLIGKDLKKEQAQSPLSPGGAGGILADVAPTLINLIDLQIPPRMTGTNLLKLLSTQKPRQVAGF
jgi:2,3-bisphosphoglycerate-independent phosphoglycerate mutase